MPFILTIILIYLGLRLIRRSENKNKNRKLKLLFGLIFLVLIVIHTASYLRMHKIFIFPFVKVYEGIRDRQTKIDGQWVDSPIIGGRNFCSGIGIELRCKREEKEYSAWFDSERRRDCIILCIGIHK